MTALHIAAWEAGREMGDRGACTVIATTLATGEPYEKVFKVYEALGRRFRRGTMLPMQEEAFEVLGYKLKPLPFKGKTLRTLTRELPDEGAYYIRTRRHAATYLDGEYHDIFSRTSLKKIRTVHRVVKKTVPKSQMSLF